MAQSEAAISRAVARLIAKRAMVVSTARPADGFVEIVLEGPGFRGVRWKPGCKVQIAMASVFETRTYTPMHWDADCGRIRLLGYIHGAGPGADWLRNVKPGDSCNVLGPRHSLNVAEANGPIAFYGDETSVGLAYAVSRNCAPPCFFHFEADDPRSLSKITEAWSLQEVNVVQRSADNHHFSLLTAELQNFAALGSTFILTGKAQTIQRLKADLRASDVPSGRILTKAYWAPGKSGLD